MQTETSPLLGTDEKSSPYSTKDDLRFFAKFTPPTAYTNSAWVVVNLIGLSFIARKGPMYLSSVAFGEIWISLIGMLLTQPLTGALSPLVSQAVGAGHYHLAGIWLQLTTIVAIIGVLIVTPTCFWVAQLLQLVGVDLQGHAEMTNTYTRWSVLGLFTQLMFNVATCWFEAQEIVVPSAVSLTAGIGAAFCYNYVFVVVLDLGVQGAALSTAATAATELLALLVINCVMLNYHRRCWPGLHVHHFLNRGRWKELVLAQALPQLASCAFDEAHNLVISMFAASLGPAAIATQNVTFNAVMLLFCIPLAFSMATSVRVGTYLGSGRATHARNVTWLAIGLTTGMGILVGVTYYYVAGSLVKFIMGPSAYDPTALQLAIMISPLVALSILTFSVMSACCGSLDGQGRSVWLGVVVGGSCWLGGVPLAAVLRFGFGLGLKGIWWGEMCGYGLASLVFLCLMLFGTDWKKEVAKAAERCAEEEPDEVF